MQTTERPLSPHLSAYGWAITSTLSILHRASGVLMSLGTVVLAAWLVTLASGPDAYEPLYRMLGSVPGRVLLLAMSGAFFFHFMNGIRHLFWDAGLGFELDTARRSGWFVVVATLFATLAFAALVLV